ncbi:NADP-dependent oxidoreductase [Nocardia sp. NPDC057353]|uniref:NADP-dependent oxidoreductase n=1 Tax=Nocardia sp. NPDC057353 TaxID=3346104 RepID=UPI00362AA612
MKTVTQHAVGGPEVLHTAEAPVPEPGPGEVLIQLGATSLNNVDRAMRAGEVAHSDPPPFTLGFDVSGRVVAAGEGAAHPVGGPVFGMVPTPTGTYSEFVLAADRALAPRPDGVDDRTAAALPTAALTAWQALDVVEPRDGEHVLVHGAAGGVGHLAVQLAVLRGARVTAVARAEYHDLLRDFGATDVIDYRTADFAATVPSVDVVLDFVGGGYGQRSLSILGPEGRYVTAQSSDAPADPRARTVVARPSASTLRHLGDLVAAGSLRVHINRVFTLADAAAAHRYAEQHSIPGKIVLVPWS